MLEMRSLARFPSPAGPPPMPALNLSETRIPLAEVTTVLPVCSCLDPAFVPSSVPTPDHANITTECCPLIYLSDTTLGCSSAPLSRSASGSYVAVQV